MAIRGACPAMVKRLLQNRGRSEKMGVRCYWQPYAVPIVPPQVQQWNRVIEEASSILPQKSSTNHEVFNFLGKEDQVEKIIRKIVGTRHPLMHETKHLIFDTRMKLKTLRLVALLVAKAAGTGSTSEPPTVFNDAEKMIWNSQLKLADTIQLYYGHFLAHNSVLNLNTSDTSDVSKELQSANGIAVLWGDYLAANASCCLASIRNSKVLALVSSGVSNFSESIFHGTLDKNCNLVPDTESPFAIWETVTSLKHASLLSRGCEGMMVLAGHDDRHQEKARDFGKYFSLAVKVNEDLRDFEEITERDSNVPFKLSLVPVILHLQDDVTLLQSVNQNAKDNIMLLDFKEIQRAVNKGNALEKTKDLLNSYINQAQESLQITNSSRPKELLEDMLESLKD